MVNLTKLSYFNYFVVSPELFLLFILRIWGYNTAECKLNLIVVYKFHLLLLLLLYSDRSMPNSKQVSSAIYGKFKNLWTINNVINE